MKACTTLRLTERRCLVLAKWYSLETSLYLMRLNEKAAFSQRQLSAILKVRRKLKKITCLLRQLKAGNQYVLIRIETWIRLYGPNT